MKALKIDHINIVCENIEKTTDFYVSLLQFEVIADFILKGDWFDSVTAKKKNKAKCIFLKLPDSELRIELLEFYDKAKHTKNTLFDHGMRHFAIEVDDIYGFRDKLLENNIVCLSEPVSVPFEILPQGKKLFYFQAPDNVIIEVAQYGIN